MFRRLHSFSEHFAFVFSAFLLEERLASIDFFLSVFLFTAQILRFFVACGICTNIKRATVL